MTYQLDSRVSARHLQGEQTNEADVRSGIGTTMLVNNPHNLIGRKAKGGVDEF